MAEGPSTRIVRLVVCDDTGGMLGSTAEFTVDSPYWGHVEPLVVAARRDLGLSVTVLRLLEVERGAAGEPDHATYLAEVAGVTPSLAPARPDDAPAPEPLRMLWAEPGGPAAQLAWAREALDAQGIALVASPIQVRTWNLSSIWRLPTTIGTVWLKAVPPFFAHEGAVIERLAGKSVPRLLARGDGICLLVDVEGDDLYSPTDEQAFAMIDHLVSIQRGPGADVGELLATGLPDWRLPNLVGPAERALALRAGELDAGERRAVTALIDGLSDSQRDLESCGLPDALVHGDFHPGNVRGSGLDLTILDWGDSGVGHVLLDQAAFTQWMPETQRIATDRHWAARWRSELPGSDPSHAAALIAPVAALRQAVIYRHFLDHIEPDERVYHDTDDSLWLRRAAALVEEGSGLRA